MPSPHPNVLQAGVDSLLWGFDGDNVREWIALADSLLRALEFDCILALITACR